jgi:hypothetical protein
MPKTLETAHKEGLQAMQNIQFEYQYRDAQGSKACNQVIFTNPDDLEPEEITLRLERAFWEAEFFVAHQIRIPEVFLDVDGYPDENLDHCFHHLDFVVLTSDPPTDSHNRSVRQFICEVEQQSLIGWRLFDPAERFRL